MPRHRRITPAGYAQHLLNRGNEKATIFHKPADYEAFLSILADGLARVPLKILAFCLMRNHFHLVVLPDADNEIPAYMHWVMNVHVRRHRRHYKADGRGHIYQGRYKNFLIEDTTHLLTVIRYVEANPVRANLVSQAESWPWSSLIRRTTNDGRVLLAPWPIERPADWVDLVNQPFSRETLQNVRTSVERNRPLGREQWTDDVIRQFGLEATRRPAHRPRKKSVAVTLSEPKTVAVPLFE